MNSISESDLIATHIDEWFERTISDHVFEEIPDLGKNVISYLPFSKQTIKTYMEHLVCAIVSVK